MSPINHQIVHQTSLLIWTYFWWSWSRSSGSSSDSRWYRSRGSREPLNRSMSCDFVNWWRSILRFITWWAIGLLGKLRTRFGFLVASFDIDDVLVDLENQRIKIKIYPSEKCLKDLRLSLIPGLACWTGRAMI